MNFNEKLIKLRKEKGLSQEELGEQLNVTRQTISKWELGQSTPEMENLIQLSKIFNVSIDILTNDVAVVETSNNANDYVGIDERYRPKNEGQSNNNQSKEDNAKKVKKIGKLVIGGVLFWVLLIVVILVVGIIFWLSQLKKINNVRDNLPKIVFDNFFGMVGTLESSPQIFNQSFEGWSGTQYGDFTRKSFDTVIQNNSEATQTNGRIVILVFNEKSMTNPSEIIESKKELNDKYKYEKHVEYDSEGYVNKVIIEELNNEEEQKFQQLFDDMGQEVLNNINNTRTQINSDSEQIRDDAQKSYEDAKKMQQEILNDR